MSGYQLPPGHPFNTQGNREREDFATLELAQGQQHGSPSVVGLQGMYHVTATSPLTPASQYQTGAFQQPLPYQETGGYTNAATLGLGSTTTVDNEGGTLLSDGSALKAGAKAANGEEPSGQYIDKDGYFCYTYTGRVATLMARDAKKIWLAMAILLAIGIAVGVPVAVTSSRWYDTVEAYIYPSPSPAAPPVESPSPAPVADSPSPSPVPSPADSPIVIPPSPRPDNLNNATCSWQSNLLPAASLVTPVAYSLLLRLREEHFAVGPGAQSIVSATANVTMMAWQNTTCVVLAVGPGMSVQSVSAAINSGLPQPAVATQVNTSVIVVSLDPQWLLPNDTLTLSLNYSATLGGGFGDYSQVGLWRSAPYSLGNGSVEAILSSDLGAVPHLPRTLFPCLHNDPTLLAPITLSVEVPGDRQALSNMQLAPGSSVGRRLQALADGSNITLFTFPASPALRLDQLALVVGRLGSNTAAVPGSNMTVKAWTVISNSSAAGSTTSQLDQAVAYASAAYTFYHTYFGVDLPFASVNLVGVPGKTSAPSTGLGVSQLDDQRLMFNPAREGAYGQFRCASAVCNALALQWLGNQMPLTSPADSHLRQGLAAWLTYKCVGHVEPSMPGAALAARLTTPAGQPLDPVEAVLLQADTIMDSPATPAIADAAAALAAHSWQVLPTPASLVATSGMAQVVAHMEWLLEDKTPGAFQALVAGLLNNGTISAADFVSRWAQQAAGTPDAATSPSVANLQSTANAWLGQAGHIAVVVQDFDLASSGRLLLSSVGQQQGMQPGIVRHLLQNSTADNSSSSSNTTATPTSTSTNNTSSSNTTVPPVVAGVNSTASNDTSSTNTTTIPAVISTSSNDTSSTNSTSIPSSPAAANATNTTLTSPPPIVLAPPPPVVQIDAVALSSQRRFCAWGVQSSAGGAATCPGPSSSAPAWRTTVLVSALPGSPADLPNVVANGTLDLITQRMDTVTPKNIDLNTALLNNTWLWQLGGNPEVQRATYDATKSFALMDQVRALNLSAAIHASALTADALTAAQQQRMSALVDAASLLADTAAAELSPFSLPRAKLPTPPKPTLAQDGSGTPLLLFAIQQALASPEAQTGLGLHLLAMPALEAYERLQVLLAANSACAAALNTHMARWLAPITKALATEFVASYADLSSTAAPINTGAAMSAALQVSGLSMDTLMASGTRPVVPGFTGALSSMQDEFALNLTKARLLWSAALVDPQAANFTCGMVVDRYHHALAVANGDTSTTAPPFGQDANWQSAWVVTGTAQPAGCDFSSDASNFFQLEVSLLRQNDLSLADLRDAADMERIVYASAHTRNATQRTRQLDMVLNALASGANRNGRSRLTLGLFDAHQLITLMARTSVVWPDTNPSSSTNQTVLQWLMANNGTAWAQLLDAYRVSAGNNQSGEAAALALLEEVVGVSISQPGNPQLPALTAWLNQGDAALGLAAGTLAAPDPLTAGLSPLQRILGRAQSSVQWAQASLDATCTWLLRNPPV